MHNINEYGLVIIICLDKEFVIHFLWEVLVKLCPLSCFSVWADADTWFERQQQEEEKRRQEEEEIKKLQEENRAAMKTAEELHKKMMAEKEGEKEEEESGSRDGPMAVAEAKTANF